MSTSEDDSFVDDDFPSEWNRQIEQGGERIFRRIHREEKAEASEIQRVSRRSFIRWLIYACFVGVLCMALWQNRDTLLRDAREFQTIIVNAFASSLPPEPLIIYPKRTTHLKEPLEHYPPTNLEQFESILQSLRYWIEKESRECMCAHHLVTDGFNHRVCIVSVIPEAIIMWNMRVTGRVVDSEAHITQKEHSQFCPEDDSIERARPSVLYVTWDDIDSGYVHVNAFYGNVARCLQMAEEEMDAVYECSSFTA